MQKPNIYTTPFGKAVYLEGHHIPNAVTFLTKNIKMLEVSPEDVQGILSTRTITQSPISGIVQHIVDAKKAPAFLFLDFTRFTSSDIPELFTMDEVTIDGGNLPKDLDAVTPANLKRIWLNITPIVKSKKTPDARTEITDTGKLHSQMVRGMLCRSYDQTKGMWLSTTLATFVIESYSMIANLIRRKLNLSNDQYRLVRILLAAYYAQLLGSPKDPMRIPPLLHGCTKTLGNIDDIIGIMDEVNSLRPNKGESPLTTEIIVKILRQHPTTSERMKNFTLFELNRVVVGATDTQSMLTAIDYPPYFVHMMLKIASGYKHPAMNSLFWDTKVKKELTKFCQDLNRSPEFIKKVNI